MRYALLISALALCWAAHTAVAAEADQFLSQRLEMVRHQIQARGVTDPRVLAAMKAIGRHLFVPHSYLSVAYGDHPLPIGRGQTISQPYIVALMSQALELKGGEKVLEIGTGSGYQAAVLARLAGQVYSIEIVEGLYKKARKALKGLGLKNVHLRLGDGFKGWPDEAPFDRIILTCAPAKIPPPLLEQLARGGIMAAPVGPAGGVQELMVLRKDKQGNISQSSICLVRFVPLVRQGE